MVSSGSGQAKGRNDKETHVERQALLSGIVVGIVVVQNDARQMKTDFARRTTAAFFRVLAVLN